MPTVKPRKEYLQDSPLRVNPTLRAFINFEFIIQVRYSNGETKLRGAGTLYKDIGHTMANKLFNKVISNPMDVYTRKFPNGKQIKFFQK